MEVDIAGHFLLAALQGTREEAQDITAQLQKEYTTVGESYDGELERAWGDVTGAGLDPIKAKAARNEEVECIRTMKLCKKVDEEERRRVTGKAPIKVRCVDISKGHSEEPNYRSRFVAKEINTYMRGDLFAATPQLEALKSIRSAIAIGHKGEIIMANDASRAFFHARVNRDAYVVLFDEGKYNHDHVKRANLECSMYGTRDAAINWHDACAQHFIDNGFVQGKVSLRVFHHPTRRIRTCVHVCDYVPSGQEADPKWMETRLQTKYEIKTKWLGPRVRHEREVKISNRVVPWIGEGIKYEADPRHAEFMIKRKAGLAVTRTRRLNNHERQPTEPSWPEPIISLDRPDVSLIVKEVAKATSRPTVVDWARLKRMVRYLVGRPRLQTVCPWQPPRPDITAYIDGGWAGDRTSGKSTSGGCLTIGQHVPKCWSMTKSLVALIARPKVGIYDTLRTAAETPGILAMARGLAVTLKGEVWGGASAALGATRRKGLGRTRHIDVSYLWAQQLVCPRSASTRQPWIDTLRHYRGDMSTEDHPGHHNFTTYARHGGNIAEAQLRHEKIGDAAMQEARQWMKSVNTRVGQHEHERTSRQHDSSTSHSETTRRGALLNARPLQRETLSHQGCVRGVYWIGACLSVALRQTMCDLESLHICL